MTEWPTPARELHQINSSLAVSHVRRRPINSARRCPRPRGLRAAEAGVVGDISSRYIISSSAILRHLFNNQSRRNAPINLISLDYASQRGNRRSAPQAGQLRAKRAASRLLKRRLFTVDADGIWRSMPMGTRFRHGRFRRTVAHYRNRPTTPPRGSSVGADDSACRRHWRFWKLAALRRHFYSCDLWYRPLRRRCFAKELHGMSSR